MRTLSTVNAVAAALDEYLIKRLVNRERIEAHKQRMLAELRADRLRELRRNAGAT